LRQSAVLLGLGLVYSVSFDQLLEAGVVLASEKRSFDADEFAVLVIFAHLVPPFEYLFLLVELQSEVFHIFEQI
jgi:hypothetical protein